jgi:hypothetical protein
MYYLACAGHGLSQESFFFQTGSEKDYWQCVHVTVLAEN